MKKNVIRFLCLLLGLLTCLLPLSACSGGGDGGDTSGESTRKPNTGDADAMPEHDFGGKTFVIYNSINEAGSWGGSNLYIEGDEHDTTSVSQFVIARNSYIEENMNATLDYVNVSEAYGTVTEYHRQLVLSGEQMDLFINKLYPMVNFSLEGYLTNVANNNYFDYFSDYWYTDYMDELSLDGNTCYFLAGDYFMDIIRSVNVLVYNMDMMDEANSENGGNTGFLETVKDGDGAAGGWTIETMLTLAENATNAASDVLDNNTYGFVSNQIWSAMIPMLGGFDLSYVTIEDGTAKIALNNETSASALTSLKALFCGDFTPGYAMADGISSYGAQTKLENITAAQHFMVGRSLFLAGERFASMANFTDMEARWGVAVYPKVNDLQTSYISPTHDTTEIGCIPRTCTQKDDVLQLLEYLSLLTHKTVMAEYYDNLLKLRYSKEPAVSEMVDLIHDNLGGSFVMGYNNAFGDYFMWQPFYVALLQNREFAAYYPTYSSQLATKAEVVLASWQKYLE